MRLHRLALAVGVALAVGAGEFSLAASGRAAAPNYTDVVSQFMCVSCHEPLELVSSPQAISEKTQLKTLIKQGMDMAQIKRAMVAQYGVEVLGKPPASGFNLTVYIVPPLIFLGGLALLAYTLPKWRRRSRQAALTHMDEAPPLDPHDAQRLDDELTNFI